MQNVNVPEPVRAGAPAPARRAGSRIPTRRVRDSTEVAYKGGRLFFVTVDIVESYDTLREDFVSFFDDLLCYCCVIEKSNVSSRIDYHLHCFLEFKSNIKVNDLADYIRVLVDGVRVDVQPCRSRKSTLKYITKEDRAPFYNCKLSELHFNYRAYQWAVNSPVFRYEDVFVMEHRFCYRYLEKLHAEVRLMKAVGSSRLRSVDIFYHCGWAQSVVDWWNKRISSKVHKAKQLLLRGVSNVGKSTFIEKLVGSQNMGCVFMPDVGKFAFQGFDSSLHKVVLFEEFNPQYHCMSMLKRLLAGEAFAAPVKCAFAKLIKFRGPVIFVMQDTTVWDMEAAFINRLCIVEATSPYWEEEVEVREIKVEPSEEDVIIEIPCEDENDGPFGPQYARQEAL